MSKKKELHLLNVGYIYFLCPDSKCQLYYKPDCHVPCDRECPKKAKKAIVCFNCRKTIVLEHDWHSCRRVDCECGASSFLGSWYLLHHINKKMVDKLVAK